MTMLVASVDRIVGMVVVAMIMVIVVVRAMGMVVPVRVSVILRIVGIHYTEARRADAGTKNRAGIDPHIRFLIRAQNEASQRGTNFLDRQTCIYERTKYHVPRRARETVEVEDGRHYILPASLKLKYFESASTR